MTSLRVAARTRPVELELEDPAWRDFVASRPDASLFHHPAWTALLADCYGLRPWAFGLANEEGQVLAGVPLLETSGPLGSRRWVSLPFTDHVPPLADAAEHSPLANALEAARRAANVSGVELRGQLDVDGGLVELEGYRHALPLGGDPELVFRTFGRSRVQQVIRRAERETEGSGLVIRAGETAADLTDVFYELHLDTRSRLGVPVQPRRFFRLLWDRLIEPGHGSVLLAYSRGAPVAGAVFLSWNGTTVYKFGASLRAFQRLRPNHLLLWTAIRTACERGDHVFDFGRTDLDNQSLREFKLGWGTDEYPLFYSSVGVTSGRVGSGRAGKALGVVLRHSPRWACRAAGELLYKYAA